MKWSWLGAALCTVGIGAHLSYRLVGPDKTVYLPGETTHGHYQIELKCESCHAERNEVKSDACLACHRTELQAADDSHPPSKFLDPRNAALIAELDARRCTTCHTEHRPVLTSAMGVTLPGDYCCYCHKDVGEERPSHAGLDYDGCQGAGCHNFHDNRALHEDFLEQHLNEPATLSAPRLPSRSSAMRVRPLLAADVDVPTTAQDAEMVASWAGSAHARAEVNCSHCHGKSSGVFREFAGDATCGDCHRVQAEGFRAGHHGMRIAAGLSPMRPGDARLRMTEQSAGRALGCGSCHSAHGYDVERAAVQACLACHADQHSLAYRGSPHALIWQAELEGRAPPGSGLSCAGCHLPRVAVQPGASERFVQHNQNDNLRPNEKMLRTVCIHCHGAAFSLDALADPALIRSNFRGVPSRHVPSMDWIETRRAARAVRTNE